MEFPFNLPASRNDNGPCSVPRLPCQLASDYVPRIGGGEDTGEMPEMGRALLSGRSSQGQASFRRAGQTLVFHCLPQPLQLYGWQWLPKAAHFWVVWLLSSSITYVIHFLC